jgi:O-antigen biosynthesis protein
VDLGIRLHDAGFWNVMTPYARVTHHESVTREVTPPQNDVVESQRAYAPIFATGDPFYNRNLTLFDTTCMVSA